MPPLPPLNTACHIWFAACFASASTAASSSASCCSQVLPATRSGSHSSHHAGLLLVVVLAVVLVVACSVLAGALLALSAAAGTAGAWGAAAAAFCGTADRLLVTFDAVGPAGGLAAELLMSPRARLAGGCLERLELMLPKALRALSWSGGAPGLLLARSTAVALLLFSSFKAGGACTCTPWAMLLLLRVGLQRGSAGCCCCFDVTAAVAVVLLLLCLECVNDWVRGRQWCMKRLARSNSCQV